MPALAAALVVALGWAMKFLVAKVLLALGLQLALVVGLDLTMDYILDNIFANINALDSTVYNVLRICRVPDAVSIIGAATLTRYSLTYGLGKLMFVARQAGA
jgi:hypothetical protein